VPSVYDPQSHNRYSYVRNNPVKYIDPTGHSFLSFLDGFLRVFSFIAKYAMPVFRLASGVLELMGGNILSGLSSIASSMSSFIKNSQFQFASQIFGFFASAAASSGGGAVGGTSSGDGATADAGGSSGGDVESGGGVINLGTGVTLSSSANFSEAPPVRVIPGITTNDPYGETTFTLVREAGATASQTTNWSLTAEGYTPWGGGGIIFGQNPNGQYFVTGRVGIGLGGGLSYNPFGQSPGYHPSDIIGIGGFAELGAGAGPLSAGVAGEGGLNMAADTQRGGFSYLYSHVNPEFGLDANIKWRLRAVAAGGIQGTFILW
jgi:hypothetical protein